MHLALGFIIAGFSILLDQASKASVLKHVKYGEFIPITPFFDITLVFNKGVSFGLLSQHTTWGIITLVVLAFAITGVMVYWLYKAEATLGAVGLGLIIGGAIGNIIDRVRLSAVVDFLHFHWGSFSFPAFNIADAAISIGAGLVLINEFLLKGKTR